MYVNNSNPVTRAWRDSLIQHDLLFSECNTYP